MGAASLVPASAAGPATVTILHFNDIYEISPVEAGKVGGLARLATVRARLKAQFPGLLTELAGVHAQTIYTLTRYGLLDKFGEENLFGNIDDALNAAREAVGQAPTSRPAEAMPEVAREKPGAGGI